VPSPLDVRHRVALKCSLGQLFLGKTSVDPGYSFFVVVISIPYTATPADEYGQVRSGVFDDRLNATPFLSPPFLLSCSFSFLPIYVHTKVCIPFQNRCHDVEKIFSFVEFLPGAPRVEFSSVNPSLFLVQIPLCARLFWPSDRRLVGPPYVAPPLPSSTTIISSHWDYAILLPKFFSFRNSIPSRTDNVSVGDSPLPCTTFYAAEFISDRTVRATVAPVLWLDSRTLYEVFGPFSAFYSRIWNMERFPSLLTVPPPPFCYSGNYWSVTSSTSLYRPSRLPLQNLRIFILRHPLAPA